MKLSSLSLATAAFASAVLVASASFRIESTPLAPPDAILGEHQELETVFTVFSSVQLEKIHVAVPGAVFVTYDESLSACRCNQTKGVNGTEAEVPRAHGHHHNSTEHEEEEEEEEEESKHSHGTEIAHDSEDGSAEADEDVGSDVGEELLNRTILMHKREHARHHKTEKLAADADKATVVAKITVTGNGSSLLGAIAVEALHQDHGNGLRIHLKNDDLTAEGFVLTQIALAAPRVVRHLVASVATSVVADANVLQTNSTHARVRLAATGATALLATTNESMDLGHLDMDVTGKGLLQLTTPGLALTSKLAPSIAGSGVIAVHVNRTLEAHELESTLSGSGALFVEARDVEVDRVSTAIYGSANVSFLSAKEGHAHEQKISVAGAGSVFAGSVLANDTKVSIRGDATVFVRVEHELKVDASFSGDVYYVGPTPTKVKTSSWFWRTPVHAAPADRAAKYEFAAEPVKTPVYVSIQIKHSLFSADPIVKHVEHSSNDGDEDKDDHRFWHWHWHERQSPLAIAMQAKSTDQATRAWMLGMELGLGALLGCVAVVTTWGLWRRHQAHRQYQPLV